MKFFNKQPFRIQAAVFLAVLFLLFLGQFFFLRWKFSVLNEQYNRVALAHAAQYDFQQLVILANQQVQGEDLAAKIQESTDMLEHQLKILGEGGRIEGTKNVITQLDPLPRATYDELLRRWNSYKESLLGLVTSTESSWNTDRVKNRIKNQWYSVSTWYDRLMRDLEDGLYMSRTGFHTWLLSLVVIDLIFLCLIYLLFTKKILKPLKLIEINTSNNIHTDRLTKDEISDLALRVNEVIEQLKDALRFVENIAEGNLSLNYMELDANYSPGKNRLADALIHMQAKLKTMNEEEQRRQWANEGLTKFVDILRASGDNISALGDKIISALVHYTRSNQGGLYLVNDDDPANKFLELISLFAFDQKKFEKQRLKLGEGILGQTYLEKETTYLVEIPQEYIRIRSGLGGAIPKAILAVPLKIDKEVYGVVELASFNEFQQHEISFVEKLGETIASTLATVKAAHRNRKLLEDSNLAAEQMRAQEEEMRQNMEELQATQEEIARKERDYLAKINTLEQQIKNYVPSTELEVLQKSLAEQQKTHEERLRQLKEQLQATPAKGDDWELAEEVEKALKMNLEALKITQDELNRPA